MSSAFPPTDEGDETHGSALPKPIRLSEAPLIAERVEGGVDGALKDAFALRSSDETHAVEAAATDRAAAEPAHAEAESITAAPATVPPDVADVTVVEPQNHAASVEIKSEDEKPAEKSAGECGIVCRRCPRRRAGTSAELGATVQHDRDDRVRGRLSPLCLQ